MTEQFQQVVELPMDVATDRNGRINMLYILFLDENFPCAKAEVAYLSLSDQLAFTQQANLAVVRVARDEGNRQKSGGRS